MLGIMKIEGRAPKAGAGNVWCPRKGARIVQSAPGSNKLQGPGEKKLQKVMLGIHGGSPCRLKTPQASQSEPL